MGTVYSLRATVTTKSNLVADQNNCLSVGGGYWHDLR
jgi:hypothetical protein